MNNVTPERKERVVKSLAVFGLLGIIIFIAWVSIQIVSVFPTAVQSLASLADTVYNYNPKAPKTITIIPTTTPVTSGTTHTLQWEQPFATGFYTFTYQCREGVAVEIFTSENNFTEAECNKKYTLGAVNQANIVIHSEKSPEITFDYTLSYFKTNDTEESLSANGSLTVIAAAPAVTEPEVTITKDETTATPIAVTPTTVPKSTNSSTITIPSFTYSYYPVSNSNGSTDLVLTYLGVGQKNSAGKFVNIGHLYQNVSGAIQFSVQNTGTKTSADWSFTAKLPGDIGITSASQKPLKPNERTTIIIAFPAVTKTDLQKFSIKVTTTEDTNKQNNGISWSTAVLR